MLISVHDYEIAARKKLDKKIDDFFSGGAQDEITVKKNGDAYQHIMFRPRVLQGGFNNDLTTTLLNNTISMPIIISPTAFHCLVNEEGELATASAACDEDIIMIVSMAATKSLNEIKNSLHPRKGKFWFQIYLQKDKKFNQTMVNIAEDAGCHALVITVDSPVFGQRERDIRNHFRDLPSGLQCANLSLYGARPHAIEFNAQQNWEDLADFQRLTTLPIVLKGVLHPLDVELALKNKIAGLMVSNHGGRQLDGTAATLDLLPDIVNAAQQKIPIILDGGIRRGGDIAKALALGANAVGIGRPVLWGLTVGGRQGVSDVLQLLRRELIHTLTLCGCRSLSELNQTFLFTKSC